MWLQGLHIFFLVLQFMVGWKFLVQGLEIEPNVALRLGLTDENRKIYPYLTVWNLVFHLVYIGLCAVEDTLVAITSTSKLAQLKGKLQKIRSFMFSSLVFPGSLVVCTAYWSLTLMDPLFLFPGPIEDLIPGWINFFIHTGVGIFALGELLLRPQIWSHEFQINHAILGIGTLLLYGIVICTDFFLTKTWIYPFVELLTWTQRLGVFLTLIFLAAIYYILGSFINTLLHGKQRKKPVKRGQKKTQKKKKN